jgi:GNAT superfamily N-acetyltransferase
MRRVRPEGAKFNWVHIVLVWVAENLRGAGYGRQLMAAMEHEPKERGCTSAHLDTFSFQARPFYESLGYEVFGTLDDYPAGHQKFFMRKALT